jgi:HTH-type transcriptional regulator/antitoxin HigA
MITNERQYRISKAQLSRLRQAVEAFDLTEAAGQVGSDLLAKAELEALRSEYEVLSEQIREYQALKSGAVTVLKAATLEELPSILVRARIAHGLSQRELAEILGLKEQQVQRYESEEYASASLRRLAEVANALQLNVSEVAELKPQTATRPSPKSQEIEWELFPVKEMYRRGWFREVGFVGSMAAAMADRVDLARQYVQEAMPRRQPAFLRRRARFGSAMDQYALWAWQCRVLLLAKKEQLKGSYSRDSITEEWLKDLARESRFDDGPRRAKNMLGEAGIPLIIEPHLPKTYLDGAAFLLPDGTPVIGITLRYDRIDNFWFVLFHELIHVMKHLRRGKLEDIFDDLAPDALPAERDDLERQADTLAGAALIPEEVWEVALARYVRTEESVRAFAEEQGIHPAIVAGRIRKEADNYVILTHLVGKGKVRAQFPEAEFAQ